MDITLRIASRLLAQIAATAVETPDEEVCGLLLGTPHEVTAIETCRNVADDRACRFEIDPAALLAAHRRSRAGGPAVIGCYHSHPGGRAEPSPRDAADAAPDGQAWLIAASTAITAWRATPGGVLHGRFDPLELVVA